MTPDQLHRIVTAIETKSLVLLCGAGLSVPRPSMLLSAISVAQRCFDKWNPVNALDPILRNDISGLAEYFLQRREFEPVFISRLVPWDDLVGSPNLGHAAVGDLLVSKAAFATLSANFDGLIEQWAHQNKVALRGALDGQEAQGFGADSSPLIKFHGCLLRSREETLWANSQLSAQPFQRRITSCAEWLRLTLPGKNLLVVGFWTDWGYLNYVITSALGTEPAQSVTVVDLGSSDELRTRAPGLWERLTTLSQTFVHIRESSDTVLNDIRNEFSRVWIRKYSEMGRAALLASGVQCTSREDTAGFADSDLYNFRRDAEGVSYGRAARAREPEPHMTTSACVRLKLLDRGATHFGAWLRIGDKSLRIINGAGRGLDEVKRSHIEPPVLGVPDVVVCVGADDLGVPPRVVADGRGSSVVRPSAERSSRWITDRQLEAELTP